MTVINGTSGNDTFVITEGELSTHIFKGQSGTDTLILTGPSPQDFSTVYIDIEGDSLSSIEILISQTQHFNVGKGQTLDLSNTLVYSIFDNDFSPSTDDIARGVYLRYKDTDNRTGDNVVISTRGNDEILAGNDGGNYIFHTGNGDDVIYGGIGGTYYGDLSNNTSYNEIYGGAGHDHIFGGDGLNILHGGDGTDVIEGKDGAVNHIYTEVGDVIFGGEGSYINAEGHLIRDIFFIEDNTDNQTAVFIENFDIQGDILNFAFNTSINRLSDIRLIDGPPGNAHLGIAGQGEIILVDVDPGVLMSNSHLWFSNDLSQSITRDGSLGAIPQHISGTNSNDIIFGQESNDTILANNGNDRLYGYAGDDTLNGGDGNDRIRAGDGDDDIIGGSGSDNLAGGSGSDNISAGSGNDIIYGNNGDDYLAGGDGRDYLYGGDGADTFVFDSLNGSDRVKDFDLSEGDSLDISNILSGFDAGVDDINDFVSLHIKSATKAVLKVNTDGQGNDSQYAGIIYGDLTGETVDTLFANNDLIA